MRSHSRREKACARVRDKEDISLREERAASICGLEPGLEGLRASGSPDSISPSLEYTDVNYQS